MGPRELPEAPREGEEATSLPHVDEHSVLVEAPAEEVWATAARRMASPTPGAEWVARALGCADVARTGPRPLEVGSTLPGFHVVRADPGRALWLAGRHRFSRYALMFGMDEAGPGRTRLRAQTRAEFPGPHGAAYRALVIGTRGHVLAVRRMLAGIKRGAERGD